MLIEKPPKNLNLPQYVSLLKSPNFDAAYIKWFTVSCRQSPHFYRRDFPPKFYVSILVFVFLSLQFNFVKYVIVACELPNDNSLDQRMLLKN